MYERILFEIDGTLVDSEWAIRLSLCELLHEQRNIRCKPEEVALYFGIPSVDSLRVLGFKDPVRSERRWKELYLKHYQDVVMFPGIADFLYRLRGMGIKLGIVTSRDYASYNNRFRDWFDAGRLFEGAVCAEDTIDHKPDPAPILAYMERFSCDPDKTIYIANSLHDFNCADQAGVHFGLSLWGCRSGGVIQARNQFDSPAELLNYISSGRQI